VPSWVDFYHAPHKLQVFVYMIPLTVLISGSTMNLSTFRNCPKCGGSGHIADIDREALRTIRQDSGLSLKKMAKRIGVSAPYLSDIELGRRGCPDYVVEAYNKLTT